MNEQMEPIHPAHAALLMGKRPEPCEPFVEISSKVLARLMDVVEFGDQLERVEKDRLLANLKDVLAEEQPELWVIHSVGPNELHPMISKEAAEQQAAELTEAFQEHVGKLGLRFDVIRSPFTPLEHFEILAEETIEHRNDLMEYVKELEQKAGAAVVNQQFTTAELVRCQCCQTEHAADSYDAGFITGSGMCQACDSAMPAKDLPVPYSLTFEALRAANAERIGSSKYRKCEENWTPAHWMQATVGELGELANILKKVDRGNFPFKQVKTKVAKELADVQTYLDILALKLGVDLGQATIDKFNEVSERIGSHVVLGAPQPANPSGFKKGDIIRYSDGCTALARLESPHAGGWHAVHCLGGTIYVHESYPSNMRRASKEDCEAFEHHRAKTLRQQGRTEADGDDA